MPKLAVALLLALGCSESDPGPSAGDSGSDASDASDAAAQSCDASGGGNFGEAGVDLDGGCVGLPPGKIACDLGGSYQCGKPGFACCDAKNLCYQPALEPDFCP